MDSLDRPRLNAIAGPILGEFLLGYHCQRRVLNPPKAEAAIDDDTHTE